MQFLSDNASAIAELIGLALLLSIAFIAITPTDRDDRAFASLLDRLSPTARKAVAAVAMAAVAALSAALLGGCGHIAGPSPEDVAAMARIVACKACAALGGAKGEACAAALGCS